jgi:uroporphyrin-III C-methyltransferase
MLVTAHARAGEVLDLDWRALADPQMTLAIYMGKGAARQVAARLIEGGMAGDVPVALVENASLPGARHVVTRLDLLPLAASIALADGPAVILVGNALRDGVLGAAVNLAARSFATR